MGQSRVESHGKYITAVTREILFIALFLDPTASPATLVRRHQGII